MLACISIREHRFHGLRTSSPLKSDVESIAAAKQPAPPAQLNNGNLETWHDESRPEAWVFANRTAGNLTAEVENPFEGQRAALLDTSGDGSGSAQRFANLMQVIDAKPWQGKRIRFRAAVRTAELGAAAKAQLWCRVDRKADDGAPRMGAFDNMQNRPIRDGRWKHYDIVLQVDDDAERMVLVHFRQRKSLA